MKVDGTNIKIIRADTEYIKVSCKDSKGAPLPFVEGDTVYLTVKKSIHDELKVLQKVITEFTDGVAFITILPNDTKGCKPGQYVYDIQLTKSNGVVKTIVPPSKFDIESGVTDE